MSRVRGACACACVWACGGSDAAAPDAGSDAGGDAGVRCGESEVPAAGDGCERVGLPAECWPGWAADDAGACVPLLPESDCSDGTIEIIGEVECQPIADCGDGPWGVLDLDADALFVDAAYAGAGADGSMERPFPRIQEAVDAAFATDQQIAVAAGEYMEDLYVYRRVRVEGRCPQEVTIRADTGTWPAVEMAAAGSALRGVTVTGDAPGIGTGAVAGVVIERVFVADAARGLWVQDGGEIAVRRSVLARNGIAGVAVIGSTATLEDVVIRDTIAQAGGEFGRGLQVQPDLDNGAASDVTARRVIVAGNREVGAAVYGSTAVFEEVVVRDTGAGAGDFFGFGVLAEGVAGSDAAISLSRALVERNHVAGVLVVGAAGVIEEATLRDALPAVADGVEGRGVTAQDNLEKGTPSTLEVRASLITGNRRAGIAVGGTTVAVEGVVVDNTAAEDDARYGDGVEVVGVGADGTVFSPTSARLFALVVRGSARAGVLFYGAGGSLDRAAIRRNVLAVALEEGADPEIGSDVVYEENDRDEVVVGQGLDPPPPVEPAEP